MDPIYTEKFQITQPMVDCFGGLKPAWLLRFAQHAAGVHCARLGVSLTAEEGAELFWAVIRHRVQITRLPREQEAITLETWPMPATRTAYPRATLARDEAGREIFRAVSLWALMDRHSRRLVLPGKSGVEVPGLCRGNELALPGSLPPSRMINQITRLVDTADLDENGHMNNARYMDWIWDLLPAELLASHSLADFTICYLSEALAGERLAVGWQREDDATMVVEGRRACPGEKDRVFSARLIFD